jgi:hypothetical protein
MTGTNCDLFTHKSSPSYLNHLVFKQLQRQGRDKLKIDPITITEWKEHYGKLSNEQDSKGEEGTEEERRN